MEICGWLGRRRAAAMQPPCRRRPPDSLPLLPAVTQTPEPSPAQKLVAFKNAFWKFLRPHTIRGTILGSSAVTAIALMENTGVRVCVCVVVVVVVVVVVRGGGGVGACACAACGRLLAQLALLHACIQLGWVAPPPRSAAAGCRPTAAASCLCPPLRAAD